MTNAASADLGKGLYRDMFRIRRFEERIKAMYHLREMPSPPGMWCIRTTDRMAGISPRAAT